MAESQVSVTEGSGAKKLHTYSRSIGGQTVEDEVVVNGEAYMAHYVASGLNTISMATANSHLYQVMAGSTLPVYIRRVRIFQVGLATAAAIAQIALLRLTTAGTGGTTHTPQARDANDGAPGSTAMDLPTVKGTEGAFIDVATAQFIQTVPAGGVGTATLLCDFDYDRLRTKAVRIPSGVTNGFCVKNLTAVANATVFVVVELSEATF